MIYYTTIYISTLDEICARCCIRRDRETTNTCSTDYTWSADDLHMLYTCSTDALQMLYKCSTAWGFNFLCKNMKAQSTNTVHEHIWKKKLRHWEILNRQLKIREFISILEISRHKKAAGITCPLEILGLWAFTQSCLYMYLSHHNQLFLKEMINVFFYKAKT